jgi:drug/metabolite transporter (DMT)-like permease
MLGLATRGRLVAAFAAIYLLWGGTYLAIAISLQSIPPFILMGARAALAGLLLLAVSSLRGTGLPSLSAWFPAAIGGTLLFGGCHGALGHAQRHVPSGLSAVVLATIPFWLLLLNFAAPVGERPKAASLLGLIPGFAGVALIAWPEASGGENAVRPAMIALLLASAFSWALGSLVSQRRAADVPALSLSGMQMLAGGAVLLVAGALAGEWDDVALSDVSAASAAALAYLVVAGGAVGFTAYVWLLDRIASPVVATYTFVNPAIAVVLGWLVLDELVTGVTVVGAAIIVVSVAMVVRVESQRRPR